MHSILSLTPTHNGKGLVTGSTRCAKVSKLVPPKSSSGQLFSMGADIFQPFVWTICISNLVGGVMPQISLGKMAQQTLWDRDCLSQHLIFARFWCVSWLETSQINHINSSAQSKIHLKPKAYITMIWNLPNCPTSTVRLQDRSLANDSTFTWRKHLRSKILTFCEKNLNGSTTVHGVGSKSSGDIFKRPWDLIDSMEQLDC